MGVFPGTVEIINVVCMHGLHEQEKELELFKQRRKT